MDSSFATPTAAQVAQAKASGVSGWSGYLATKPNVGLANPWTQADFQTVLDGGLFSIAFCSGWDDPVACKNLAAAWGVRLCLDVEGGIRGDGEWVQAWLDVSGAGLYGNSGVHPTRNAAFHILAAYPSTGDPNATWYSGYPRPAGPVGWQWRGTHTEFGASVDRGWYDDWFVQPQPQEEDTTMFIAVVQGTPAQWLVMENCVVGIDTGPDSAALQAAGIKQSGAMSQAQFDGIVTAQKAALAAGAQPSLSGSLSVSGTLQVTP